MSKYTPGPWKVESYIEPYNTIIATYQVITDDGLIVAKCGKGFQTKDNANLIAAAPELLQILEGILFKWECDEPGNAQVEFQALARQLIDKVKGENNVSTD